MVKTRESRKNDHIKYALLLNDGPQTTGFEGIHLMHNSLPELDLKDIDLSTYIAGYKLQHPLIINAITGGNDDVISINKNLAEVAAKTSTPMAVGSQYGAIKNKKGLKSYEVIRKVNPNGLVFANISALATIEDAEVAVQMLQANALQIHLNVAQELAMSEGDRTFRGYLHNISEITKKIKVPVIVKETGSGMTKDDVKKLLDAGVKTIDISGAGGTNFPSIEASRSKDKEQDLIKWGIPTAVSLIEARGLNASNLDVIASGGIRTPLDGIKALALGASAIAMARNILELAKKEDAKALCDFIFDFTNKLKALMLLTGAKNIKALRYKRMYFTGEIYQILHTLGYNLQELSKKR